METLKNLNKPRAILFSVLALLTIQVFWVFERNNLNDAETMKRFMTMALVLIPHGILGMVALVTGPFQFSTTLRKRNLRLHRRLGKVYITAVLLSAPLALFIAIFHPIPGANGTFLLEGIMQALVWGFTAGMAWVAIRRRNLLIHKIWAARSYGVTLIFVLSRVYDPAPLLKDNPDINDFGHFLWFLMVLALILPDILIFNKELFGKGKRTAELRPAADS